MAGEADSIQQLLDRMARREAEVQEAVLRQLGVTEANAHQAQLVRHPGESNALTMPGGVIRVTAPWLGKSPAVIRHEDIFGKDDT